MYELNIYKREKAIDKITLPEKEYTLLYNENSDYDNKRSVTLYFARG